MKNFICSAVHNGNASSISVIKLLKRKRVKSMQKNNSERHVMKLSMKFIIGAVVFIIVFSVVAFKFQDHSLLLNARMLYEKIYNY